MSDLPSRDFFNGNDITMSGNQRLIEEAVSVLDAYAAGRLVDREAIDYEAAAIAWLGPKSAYEADPDAQRVTRATDIGWVGIGPRASCCRCGYRRAAYSAGVCGTTSGGHR